MSSTTIPFQTFPPTSHPPPPPSPATTSFSLTPQFSTPTDIWRKPSNAISNPAAAIETFNAPIIYKKIALSTFKRLRVTVTGKWERLYDQGGLVLILPARTDSGGEAVEDIAATALWVKTGVEFVEERAWVSTVACQRWADWSLSSAGIISSSSHAKTKTVTLELERNPVEGTLWIYVIEKDGVRVPLREVTWILSGEGNGGGKEREAWVGVYAATPIIEGREEEDGLKVSFEGWELELSE